MATNTEKYLVDPKEAGFTLNTGGCPTDTGWKVVTPETWDFRTRICDKIQTVEGYYDPEWYMDCTKAKITIEVNKEQAGTSPAQFSAEILKRYLEKQNIVIRPNEIVVGNWGSDPHAIPFEPRYDVWRTYLEFYDDGHAFHYVDGKKVPVKQELSDEFVNFQKQTNVLFNIQPSMDETEYRMYSEGGQRFWEVNSTTGMRANPDHDYYMNRGLRGCIDDMNETIERLRTEASQTNGSAYVDIARRIGDCKASVKATEAVIAWIKRHAKVAGDMAQKATDPKDKERLNQIASNCEWVAENPPRTFWEAMQYHWLVFLVDNLIEMPSHTITFRPDQVFWKWYEKDVIKEKTIDRTKAADIWAMYMMKYHEIGLLVSLEDFRKTGVGTRDYTVLTLGGQTGDGKDAFNELSSLILDVADGYRLHFPDLKVRWHPGMHKPDFRRVIEIMRTGMGSPSLRSDPVSMQALYDQYGEYGLTLEEARSWAVVGCNSPGITINSKGVHRRAAWCLNILKSLELTIFDGHDPDPDWAFAHSIETGNPTEFDSYDKFYDAWLKQYDWQASTGSRIRNLTDAYWQEWIRRPFLTILYKRCITEGRDVMTLDVPWLSFFNVPGLVDLIDSLAAVKLLIFEKKKYTMAQLIEALKAEWKGFEDMQRDFKEAPKFGNNNEFADSIMQKVVNDIHDVSKHCLDLQNQAIYPHALVVTWMYHLAPLTGALPNGRKRGEALCDGGINPHAEFDKGGPWDRLSSAMSVDQTKLKAWIYNQKFDYNSVQGDAGLDKLVDFSEAGMEGGMTQLQYNMVSRDILADAKKNPEKYPFLSVRISGYSAYFTSLPEYVQDAVIQRVDNEL